MQRRQLSNPDRIDLGVAWDVRYWCRKWRCTPAELKRVVAEAGDDPDAVARAFVVRGNAGVTRPENRGGDEMFAHPERDT